MPYNVKILNIAFIITVILAASESSDIFVTHSTLSNSEVKLPNVSSSIGILLKVPLINTNGTTSKITAYTSTFSISSHLLSFKKYIMNLH